MFSIVFCGFTIPLCGFMCNLRVFSIMGNVFLGRFFGAKPFQSTIQVVNSGKMSSSGRPPA